MESLKQAFTLSGGKIGCLLLHGFTSTPAEQRPLGDYLYSKGLTVHAPLLAGHGTTPADLLKVEYLNWLESARQGYHKLQTTCEQIVVIGHSMGGLLAIQLATEFTPLGLICLAPALKPNNRWVPLSGILRHFVPYSSWGKNKKPPEQQQYLLGYDRFPVYGVYQLHRLAKTTAKILNQVKVPTLIIQGTHDKTVKPCGVEQIYRGINSFHKRKIWLADAGHGLTVEPANTKVFGEIQQFIREIT